jgi:hypothetical protein
VARFEAGAHSIKQAFRPGAPVPATSIAEVRSHPARAADPGVVQRYGFHLAGHFFEFHRTRALAFRRDHEAVVSLCDQVGAGGAEACRQQAVPGGRGAAALYVAEDRDAGFEAGQGFEAFGEAQGAVRVEYLRRIGFLVVGLASIPGLRRLFCPWLRLRRFWPGPAARWRLRRWRQWKKGCRRVPGRGWPRPRYRRRRVFPE